MTIENIKKKKSYFFCGLGGSGMSSIAQVMLHQGYHIKGSDRSFDQGKNLKTKGMLEDLGIKIYPQDGSGITDDLDTLVVSTAVEASIPDVKASIDQNIPIKKRAEILSWLFNAKKGIAVSGTSGKSTITGLIGHILTNNQKKPSVINGGIMENYADGHHLGNAICGDSEIMVIEADESDGTIDLYDPSIGIISNITLDHKPLNELQLLFTNFSSRTKDSIIINKDCPQAEKLIKGLSNVTTFSLKDESSDYYASSIELSAKGSHFTVNGQNFFLPIPGEHNISNALPAIAASIKVGLTLSEIANALQSFRGIRRRMQVVGESEGITVIDDFGHNPEKIEASLNTLNMIRNPNQRLLLFYQPHGFAPTRLLKKGLIESFSKGLHKDDYLIMPEIFYAGGTTTKDISSNDLLKEVINNGKKAIFCNDREEAFHWIQKTKKKDDIIIIMGARDDTLTEFANSILTSQSGDR